MKKLFFSAFLLLFLSACGSAAELEENSAETETLSIYTTVYPLSYFTERIGGERVDVQSIYPAGANEHTFEPTQQDMISIAEADAMFYIGLGLEGFIDDAKETLKNEEVRFVATADAISDSELEEGHLHEEASEEEAHTNEEDEAHAHEEEGHEGHDHGDTDPHVWISPVLSQHLAESIKNELIELDAEGAAVYEENYEALVQELEELDQSFADTVAGAEQKTFFVSHAAFGYLTDQYGLEQVAIAGLNSQSEPSQKELTEIVSQAQELGIEYVVFEQNVSSNLTQVIQKEIGAEAVQLHNLSVLTQEDIDKGETYFTLMEKNRQTLEQILN